MPELQQANDVEKTPDPVVPQDGKSQRSFVDRVTNNFNPSKFDSVTLVVIILAGIILVEFVISWFMVLNKQSAIKTQEEKISQTQAELNSPNMDIVKKQYDNIVNGLASYKKLNPDSTNLAKMYSEIEKSMIDNTRISTLNYISDGSVLQISGEAKTFSDLARLIASFKKSQILTNVELVSSGSGEGIKQYTLKTTYSTVNSTTNPDTSNNSNSNSLNQPTTN